MHSLCNHNKSGTIFDKGAALYYLNIAKVKIQAAQKEEQKVIHYLKTSKLLASLEIALSEGMLSREAIVSLLNQEAQTAAKVELIVITFGLNYLDLWGNEQRPKWLEEYDCSEYARVCDLLEEDLVKQLKSLLTCDFFYPEPSAREGETLSVRLAFAYLDEIEMNHFNSAWWEILEVATFSDIYEEVP